MPRTPKPRLSIVMVNYKTGPESIRCLASIPNSTRNISYETILVDNNSRDGSLKMIQDQFPEVKYIQNNTNLGYGTALNQGILASRGEIVLLINSDLEFKNDSIFEMMMAIKKPRTAMVGPILFWELSDRIQPSYFPQECTFGSFALRYTLFRDKIRKKITNDLIRASKKQGLKSVGLISGACMMVKKSIIKKIGLFDRKLFLFFEEEDICRRIRKAGYNILWNPKAQVRHFGHCSTEKSFSMGKKSKIYKESLAYFSKKHFGRKSGSLILWLFEVEEARLKYLKKVQELIN